MWRLFYRDVDSHSFIKTTHALSYHSVFADDSLRPQYLDPRDQLPLEHLFSFVLDQRICLMKSRIPLWPPWERLAISLALK